MNIIKTFPAVILVASAFSVQAQNVEKLHISGIEAGKDGDRFNVSMKVSPRDYRLSLNREIEIVPVIWSEDSTQSLELPSITIAGKNMYHYDIRNGRPSTSDAVYRSGKGETVEYNQSVDYEPWMDKSTFGFLRRERGCCGSPKGEETVPVAEIDYTPEVFAPQFVYTRPKAQGEKIINLEGQAYIDFPVDQTVIYPDYRRNTVELGKIQATIDSVRNDKDVTITSVWLKGFASPESPYKHNTELAIGRTAALKKHIGQLYHFADNIIQTDYEPEDWAGLRRYVEQSNINHRKEILALIDSDMEPDAKEAKIKRTYPEEYRFMLQHFYPALRHTDYRIDYNIRMFSEVEEIKRIMAERPQKLSQNEFYLVAEKYEPGTDEFTDVFETAVRMFPNDEVANLNAANAAIRRDDFATARKYLDKAGDSAEVAYARAALAVREGDYETARQYLNQAKEMGLEKAGLTLEELENRRKK